MATFIDGEGGASVRAKINAAITTVDGLGSGDNLLMTADERAKVGLVTVTGSVNLDALATEGYVDTVVAGLVDSSPATLDTLNELAAALGDDPNFATTISGQIGAKANTADLATVATSGAYSDLSGLPTLVTALNGLSDVDTTGEAEGSILVRRSGVYVVEAKPTSSGTPAWGDITGTLSSQTDLQTALDGKQAAGSYATAAQGATADSALQSDDISNMLVSDASGITVVTAGEVTNLVTMSSADADTYEASGEYDPSVLIATTD